MYKVKCVGILVYITLQCPELNVNESHFVVKTSLRKQLICFKAAQVLIYIL